MSDKPKTFEAELADEWWGAAYQPLIDQAARLHRERVAPLVEVLREMLSGLEHEEPDGWMSGFVTVSAAREARALVAAYDKGQDHV